jgi:hypothetical protein
LASDEEVILSNGDKEKSSDSQEGTREEGGESQEEVTTVEIGLLGCRVTNSHSTL